MPNDAKLGLAVGVGLVIAVAVVYYRAESTAATADPAATIVQPDQSDPPPPPVRNGKRPPTTSTARVEKGPSMQVVGRHHRPRATRFRRWPASTAARRRWTRFSPLLIARPRTLMAH